jgi:hypothetical protein
MENTKLYTILGVTGGIIALVVMIAFVGQGNIREVPLYYPEKVEQTVIFEDVGDKVILRAISGVKSEPNPTLISRTSFAYILTVINNGDKHHRLFIEGMNVQTDLLEPGQNDTITMIPTEEGIYNYYDKREGLNLLGQIQIKTVVPSDEFQGFLKDLI